MAGFKGHRFFFFLFRKRRVVGRETKKCSQDRGRLSVGSSGGRGTTQELTERWDKALDISSKDRRMQTCFCRARKVYFYPAFSTLEDSMMEKKIMLQQKTIMTSTMSLTSARECASVMREMRNLNEARGKPVILMHWAPPKRSARKQHSLHFATLFVFILVYVWNKKQDCSGRDTS